MTGAGSSTVAYAVENSFLGGVGTSPTYYLPGKNVTTDDVELGNALRRIRLPDQAESVESIAENLEGAFRASWILTNDNFHDLVFNDTDGSGNDIFSAGRMPSSEWYLGLDYLDGTVERQLKGVAATDVEVRYQQGGPVRVTMTFVYGDEQYNTGITPGTIDESGTPVEFHGASLSVDAVAQSKLQTATLSLTNLARFHRGADRKPLDVVLGAVEESLDAASIYSENDQLELAYGSGTATSPQTSVGGVSASLSFSAAGSTVLDYSLSGVTPDTYNWQDLVNPDSDITEELSYHVNGVTA